MHSQSENSGYAHASQTTAFTMSTLIIRGVVVKRRSTAATKRKGNTGLFEHNLHTCTYDAIITNATPDVFHYCPLIIKTLHVCVSVANACIIPPEKKVDAVSYDPPPPLASRYVSYV